MNLVKTEKTVNVIATDGYGRGGIDILYSLFRLRPAFMRPLISVSAVIDSPRMFLSARYYKESKPYSERWYDNGSKHCA